MSRVAALQVVSDNCFCLAILFLFFVTATSAPVYSQIAWGPILTISIAVALIHIIDPLVCFFQLKSEYSKVARELFHQTLL